MAAKKKDSTAARKNGQPTPSSSKRGTRSNTPASKASQLNTPVPANINGKANGHSNSKKDVANTKDQAPSTPAQKAANGGRDIEMSTNNTLTEATLTTLSNGQLQSGTELEPPSSPLSSPPASMVGELEAYFERPMHEQSPAKEVPTTPSTKGEAVASAKVGTPDSVTSRTRSSRKRSRSSTAELALPDPPVPSKSSRATARGRGKKKTNSPGSISKDDLAAKSEDVASSVCENSKSKEDLLRRSKRPKTEHKPDVELGLSDVEFDLSDVELPYGEATPTEIAEWDGWLEMESNPETITVMLQEWGIRGMKAIDVWSLEPEALVLLPQPVHGLIFLYPYQQSDRDEQMDPCPDHVWFSNQVCGTNACATVALMNIVNNVPTANLGPSLQNFKSNTIPMTAAERGDYLNSFIPIKAVHNSFARVNQMMEDDIAAKKDYEKWLKEAAIVSKKAAAAKLAVKKKKAAAKKSGKGAKVSLVDKTGAGVAKSGKQKKYAPNKAKFKDTKKNITAPANAKKQTEAMVKAAAKQKADALARARYHYVAYLPINGEIWKMDGMDEQPLNLGACDHATWLDSVAPIIQASMADLSEDGINFSLLAVVQDPLHADTLELAANIKTMQQVQEELANTDSDWPIHPDAGDLLGDESLDEPSPAYNITEDMITAAVIASSNQEQLQEPMGVGSLLKLKKKLTSQQKMLKSSIRSEKVEENRRQVQVKLRRRDFGPLIQWQLMDLIDNGVLDGLLDGYDPDKKNSGAGKSTAKVGKAGKGKAKPKSRK